MAEERSIESKAPAPAPDSRLFRTARILAVVLTLVIAVLSLALAYFAPSRTNAPAPEANDATGGASSHSTRLNPPRPLSDFALTDQSGAPLRLSDLNNKYVLLFFGYTSCPDVCPTTMADFVRVKRELSTLSSQVRFVFVSVDGQRDTPPVLARFVKNFDPAFIGLQGDDATLNRIGGEYGLYYSINKGDAGAPYTVTHTSSIYLIDRTRKLRLIYGLGAPPTEIANDIADLLSQE